MVTLGATIIKNAYILQLKENKKFTINISDKSQVLGAVIQTTSKAKKTEGFDLKDIPLLLALSFHNFK